MLRIHRKKSIKNNLYIAPVIFTHILDYNRVNFIRRHYVF
ncbi:hypothetical protein BPUTSESOX_2366 [uncultured Gammaproteobacteria bacterium]|nr:hypothetical protein [uncultured Gammaproteobacteria bacterium]VVH50615.1 hypothetical protein BPUTSESOX_2366 [uncultured Gammaproteobacteria bacterium]